MRDTKGRFVKGYRPSPNTEFKKGFNPHNKGKSGWTNLTSFKKGHEQLNTGKTHWTPKIVSGKEFQRKRIANLNRGVKHHNWKGGISPENMVIRTSLGYKRWRRNVFKRDDYTCQICGKRGVFLRANHIKKFADYPELRLVKDNGVTICKECDLKWVIHREPRWESYFNFNLETRRCQRTC